MESTLAGADFARQAEVAEEAFAFQEAYGLFLQAARAADRADDVDGAIGFRVRAALALERAQDWRAHTALWEHVGDRLGERISPRFHSQRLSEQGQSEMFHVISFDGWRRLATDRDRQAGAYLWAARGAEQAGSHDLAGRLYLKAGIAYELCARAHARRSRVAAAWRVAANCFFLAAVYAAASFHPEDRDWERVLRARKLPAAWLCEPETTGLERLSHVARLRRAWHEYAATTGRRAAADRHLCDQLKAIQRALDTAGRRSAAIELHRIREQVLFDPPWLRRPKRVALLAARRLTAGRARETVHRPASWIARQARRAHFVVTRSGSSVTRAIGGALLLYVVVFPLLWSAVGGGLVRRDYGAGATVDFGQTIVFSLANLVSLSVRDYAIAGAGGATMQALEGISAYFVLGYVVWVIFRSFSD